MKNEIKLTNQVSGGYDVTVVGVSFYQDELRTICDGRAEEGIEGFVQAEIIAYDDNPYDDFAVRIAIVGKTVGHLSRKCARIWRSKMISEGFSGAITCPAKIRWDRGAFTAGSYGVWLSLDLTLSDSVPEKQSALSGLAADQPDQIEFLVNELNRFELMNCKVGDVVNLWDATHSRQIFIYRHGADFGEGKIGVCPDEFYSIIAKAQGCDASILSIYEGGCKIACRPISKAEMADKLRPFKAAEKKERQNLRRDLITPVEYSSVDSDIYSCFIYGGGLSGIETVDQFKEIEERIARICKENNGKYYKTKAKTAKFAIIFDPGVRTISNVKRWKEEGYKVTTFEKALEHFALTHLWDCKKHSQYEYDLKKGDYEITFGKPFPLSKGDDYDEGAVSAMAVHARSVHKVSEEIIELIMKIENLLDQKRETLSNEESKDSPNQDKVDLYETQIETLKTAVDSLSNAANDLENYE